MDKHRQIAFIVAFIIAMVIMMIGKSCTDSAIKKQNKTVKSSTSQSVPDYSNNNYNNNYNNAPQQNNNQVQTEAVQQVTEPQVEYVTNMLGEVIGTAEPTTTAVQLETDENGEYSETPVIQETTQGKSILEQYNEGKQNNQNQSSGNVRQKDENYQIPSEIKITIH
ncbi:MAG: hypothetical protein K2F73_05425 [Ruminococcus sp.]|nr:hypothetical protein [Ruminococcus sp.]